MRTPILLRQCIGVGVLAAAFVHKGQASVLDDQAGRANTGHPLLRKGFPAPLALPLQPRPRPDICGWGRLFFLHQGSGPEKGTSGKGRGDSGEVCP